MCTRGDGVLVARENQVGREMKEELLLLLLLMFVVVVIRERCVELCWNSRRCATCRARSSRWKCKTATSLGIKWLNKIQLNPPSRLGYTPTVGFPDGGRCGMRRDAATATRPTALLRPPPPPSAETARKNFLAGIHETENGVYYSPVSRAIP